MKYIQYNDIFCSTYFWRTKQQQEIDYLEEAGGILHAYEFEWKNNKKAHLPKTFSNAYKDSMYQCITPDNYIDFVAGV